MLVEAPLSPSISSLNVTDIISQIRFYYDKGLPNYPVAKIAPRHPNSVCFYKAEKRLACVDQTVLATLVLPVKEENLPLCC